MAANRDPDDEDDMRRHPRVPRPGVPVVGDHDVDPTPPDREVVDRRPRRVATAPRGVPYVERPSRAMLAVAPEEITPEVTDSIPVQVEFAMRRASRGLLKVLIPIAVAALGALGGMIKTALDSREIEGERRANFERLKDDVRELLRREQAREDARALEHGQRAPRRDEPDPRPTYWWPRNRPPEPEPDAVTQPSDAGTAPASRTNGARK